MAMSSKPTTAEPVPTKAVTAKPTTEATTSKPVTTQPITAVSTAKPTQANTTISKELFISTCTEKRFSFSSTSTLTSSIPVICSYIRMNPCWNLRIRDGKVSSELENTLVIANQSQMEFSVNLNTSR